MSSNTSTATGLTRCTLCSLGCRAGLRETAPDQYVPAYPEGQRNDYAGLCARGSMLAELANHRERLLWPLASINGAYAEVDMERGVRRAAEILRDGLHAGQARAVLDGNFDLRSLTQAVGALEKALPRTNIGLDLPAADAEMLCGCESSGADYVAPAALAEADAILIVGNPFATHPVVAHWLIHPRLARARRPMMVLDVRGGITQVYGSSRCLVAAGREHIALGIVAQALNVRTGDVKADGLDAALLRNWAKTLSAAKQALVIVSAEFGRAARWFEIGRLAGDIAKAVGGKLLPLTIYGNALGAARLAEKLSLGDAAALLAPAKEKPTATVTLALGTGLAERVCGGGRYVAASGLRPVGAPGPELYLPVAWPFEAAGPVLLPGQGLVNSSPAIGAPAGVPTVGALATAIAGSSGTISVDFASLPRLQRGGARLLDLSPLLPASPGEGLLTVLAGDGVNFADGWISRRAAFARSALPQPILAINRGEAARLGLSDGAVVDVAGAGSGKSAIRAMIMTEEDQAPGRATLSGAYPEARRLMAEAAGGDGRTPAMLRVRANRH